QADRPLSGRYAGSGARSRSAPRGAPATAEPVRGRRLATRLPVRHRLQRRAHALRLLGPETPRPSKLDWQPRLANPIVTGADEERASSTWSRVRPLVVLALMLSLAAAAWWLLGRLTDASRIQGCVMSGRKNCAPIDTDSLGK